MFSLTLTGVFEPFIVNLPLIGDKGACLINGEHLIGETGLTGALRGDLNGELVR